MMLALVSFFAIQSCEKDDTKPVLYSAAVPSNPSPALNGVVALAGAPVDLNLTWDATATDAISWTIYMGRTNKPKVVKTNVSGNSFDTTLTTGGTIYWKVETIDSRGVLTTSDLWRFELNSIPNVPALTAPADLASGVSITSALTWTCTDPEATQTLTYDLYLGTSASPGLAVKDITSATYSPVLVPLTTYYWKVVVKDGYGGERESVVRSFTTGALPVTKFVASYSVAENSVQNGAYAYTCAFTKVDNNTIKCDNWWDSGWATEFTLDYVKNLITMKPFTYVSGSGVVYSCSGAGIINQTTGQIDLTYAIIKNGVLLENGVDVFTITTKGNVERQIPNKPKL